MIVMLSLQLPVCVPLSVIFTESSKMGITYLADFIAPRSLQDISHCKYFSPARRASEFAFIEIFQL